MTGTAVAPMQAFQDRVKEKLKTDIGQLLPDDVVQGMVERVISEEFFTKKLVPKNPHDRYCHEKVERYSEFQEMVIEAAKPLIQEAVTRTLEEHRHRMQREIDERVKAGILTFAIQQLDRVIAGAFERQPWEFQQSLQDSLRNMGIVSNG